ncbi:MULTISPECIES: type I polyketide synthase [Streptomyces]|uniref:type I polyketide synthase n=1 Tax=Streptomyces TaxID=1883 RepID=UPI0004C9C488|nr:MULTISPECIES: type I polyketide synthase [Streptomyces]
MTYSDTDVAIIGMACRFPGADSVEQFWNVLHEGRETLTRYTDEELLAAGVPPERLADPGYVKAGQEIPDVDLFDADLFQITPDEAEILDPQHRIFLECALTALERSGYDPDRTDGHIGVYAGAGLNTYLLSNLSERYRAASSVDHYRLMLANDKDFLATRTSYKLNLRGPSLSVNTACSTSLVAVHTACLALLGGECDMALVGAVHLAPRGQGYQYQEGMIFSPDGHCRAFDAQAQGTVIGSGAGVVVLKRLKEALADGDWIHAVVKGSAVNNDGANKTGYTAPSIAGQAEVIADAHEVADVTPDSIGYVEAHGTGTPLGDPIEVAALTQAFRQGTDDTGFCGLGSVKTNVGHLDTAAGMAGLIKTALMLEKRSLVPSLHFTEPNPEIDFASSPFYVSTGTADWPATDGPRRAGVSSFGIGGTNAHIVLQEPPAAPEPAPAARTHELLVLSAGTEAGLRRATTALARHLRQHKDLDLGDVAATLGLGRRGHRHRLALVADGARDAAMALALGKEERLLRGTAGTEETGDPVLVLTGAGAAAADSAELYRAVPAYRSAVDACAAALPGGVEPEALPAGGGVRAAFCHEYAVATALLDWGVTPAGLAAAGTGLAVAAALTGALALPDALALAEGGTPTAVQPPRLPVLSARTGGWLTEDESRQPANWAADTAGSPSAAAADALEGLLADEERPLLRLAPDEGAPAGAAHLLTLAGQQWVRGAALDFAAVHAGRDLRRLPLPTYPFERSRYWVEPGRTGESTETDDSGRLVAQFDPADPARSVELITDWLVEEAGRLLGGRDRVGLDANLFDMGVDSLVLIEVVSKLSKEVDFTVPPTSFIEFPTVRAFVDNLAELMGLTTGPQAGAAAAAGRVSRRARRAQARQADNQDL